MKNLSNEQSDHPASAGFLLPGTRAFENSVAVESWLLVNTEFPSVIVTSFMNIKQTLHEVPFCIKQLKISLKMWRRDEDGRAMILEFFCACPVEQIYFRQPSWLVPSWYLKVPNVTQVVTWSITSYGAAGEKSPAPRAPINRFGKENSFHFNNEIEKPTHWFNFWTWVILSVRPNDDNHYRFLIFT